MVDFGVNPYEVSFAAFVPLAVLAVSRLHRRTFIALSLMLIALGGWALLFAAEAWVDSQWFALMAHTPNPSVQLQTVFNTDGASKAVTLLFGFPLSLAYTIACLFIVRMVIWLHKKWHHA